MPLNPSLICSPSILLAVVRLTYRSALANVNISESVGNYHMPDVHLQPLLQTHEAQRWRADGRMKGCQDLVAHFKLIR